MVVCTTSLTTLGQYVEHTQVKYKHERHQHAQSQQSRKQTIGITQNLNLQDVLAKLPENQSSKKRNMLQIENLIL